MEIIVRCIPACVWRDVEKPQVEKPKLEMFWNFWLDKRYLKRVVSANLKSDSSGNHFISSGDMALVVLRLTFSLEHNFDPFKKWWFYDYTAKLEH